MRTAVAAVLALVALPLAVGPQGASATVAASSAKATPPASTGEAGAPSTPGDADGESGAGRSPLVFEPNRGQTDEQVDYLARGSGYTLFLTGGEAVFNLTRSPDSGGDRVPAGDSDTGVEGADSEPLAGSVLRMRLVGGATDPSGSGVDRLPGASNYLRSDDPAEWQTGVPHYGAVRYDDVYPGVDAVYRSDEKEQLEYDFHVDPGADPARITLGFDGAEGLRLSDDGALLLDTAVGTLRQQAPVAYQPASDGQRETVDAEFVRRGPNQVGFEVGAYDADRPLVIDPVVVYSTFVGGHRDEAAFDVAADSGSNAYLTGTTESTAFPTTTGAYDDTCGAGDDGCRDTTDAFVTKLDTAADGDGPSVAYSTYLGGSADDRASAVAIDAEGAAYVTGWTTSDDFPTTDGAHDRDCGADGDGTCDGRDVFVAKLAPTGSALSYSTYLGGSGREGGDTNPDLLNDTEIPDIAVEGGHAYVTGDTTSGDFPTTQGAYDRDCGADGDGVCDEHRHGTRSDAFVTKLATDGSELAYSTYLGGSGRDHGRGIAVDGGHAYVTGDTHADFPTTDGAFQSDCADCAFVAKLASDGSGLDYSTYLGGGSLDHGRDLAVDGSGSAYVTGDSQSSDFPTTDGGFETDCGGNRCAFVTKLAPAAGGLEYSSRFGTSRDGRAFGESIALDETGRAHVAGVAGGLTFPVTDDAYDDSCGGCRESAGGDGFVVVLPSDGSSLEYATFLGGSHPRDYARGVAVDDAGDIYVAGGTRSSNYPTMDATQAHHGGDYDAFVTKLTRQPQRPIVYDIDQTTGPTSGGTEVTITGRGLGEVSEIRFGDQPVAADDFTVDSDTSITATAPPVGPPATKPDTAMVTVTDVRGTSPPTSRARFTTYQGNWRALPDLASRKEHTATRLDDGRVLLAGGANGDGLLDSVEAYDPGAETATVTSETPMPTARTRHSATRLDGPACEEEEPPEWCGHVLVAGGLGDDGQALATAEVYDPEAETWTATVEEMDTARASHTATRLPDGRVLVAGGLVSARGQELASAEIYNPEDGTWHPATPLENGRGKHTATALDDGRVLVVGGIALNEESLPRIPPAEVYNPGGNNWNETSPAPARHFQHTATKLADGRVLIAGGVTALVRGGEVPTVPTSLASIFDPAAEPDQAWESAASMTNAHATHAAARLADSRVLVAGGHRNYAVSDAEAYESGGDEAGWHLSAPMLVGDSPRKTRKGQDEEPAPHTATLLSASPDGFAADPAVCGDQCGQVLVVGNAGNFFTPHDPPAELYTPAPSVSGIEPLSGGQGTEVTLTGAGFDENTEVLFGQTPAQDVTVDSFGQLTAVAPAGTSGSDAQVTVRNPQGLDAAPQRFTYPGGTGGTGGTDEIDGADGPTGDTDGAADDTAPAAVDDPDRAPGRVEDLAAEAQSGTEVQLSWSAVGADGDGQAPPAGDYIVKQSTEPIDSDAAFDDAFTLCGEACTFGPAAVGDPLSLTVTELEPDTTYHYAVKARDPAGNLGERSESVSATTTTGTAGSGPASACDDDVVPASDFSDVAGSVHESAIDCLAWYAITLGLGDVDGDGQPEYGPQQPITRAQMATFLTRVAAESGFDLPTDAPDAFGDDDGSIHAPRIDALAALGITEGKGDLDGDGQPDYAPGEPVSRAQMASFLIRLHQRVTGTLPDAGEDRFGDDDGSVHEDNINALATLGVTEGKGDLDGDGRPDYAPRNPVSRAQMASFLARELGQLADAGAVHPGGAEVLVDSTEIAAGDALTGRVRSHRQVTGLVADGCGASEEPVTLNERAAFTVAVPADVSAGACELTLTATVQPVDPAAESEQRVPYRFDVTVTE